MPNNSKMLRAGRRVTIVFSALIGIGIAVAPAGAATKPQVTNINGMRTTMMVQQVKSQITIINGTRTVMIALQVKPQGAAWTEILARRPLGTRQQTTYLLPPGPCKHYEIRAMFADGRAVNKKDQDFCSRTYLVTDF